MIRIVPLMKHNRNQHDYELAVQNKMKLIENLSGYGKFEEHVQKWVDDHCGDSLDGISARVYLDKIQEMTDDELVEWYKNTEWYNKQ